MRPLRLRAIHVPCRRKATTFEMWASAAIIVVIALLVGSTFYIGVKKHLVGTIAGEEWGRYLFGIGAALTQSRFGISGFVIDNPIEQKLQTEGLTDNSEMLNALGVKFPDNLRDERLLQRALEQARLFDVPPPPPGDYQRLRGSSGDDVGIVTYTRLSFWLFGLRVSSLYYTYFVLLAAAIILFSLSHCRSPTAMACLALLILSLYLLVASDLVNFVRELPRYVDQSGVDIKDPRFVGTIAAVPALHLIVAWIRDIHMRKLDYVLLAGQACLLTLVLHIRWPLLWLIIALCGYWALLIPWRRETMAVNIRKFCNPRSSRSLFPIGMLVLVVSAGILATSIAAHPVYRLEGDLLHHPVWHNMMTSLEKSPEWDRKYLATVNAIRGDLMPTEIARQEIAKLPPDQRAQYLIGRINWPTNQAVNLFARKRFFEILRTDPWVVLEVFLLENPNQALVSATRFYFELVRVLSPLNVIAIIGVMIVSIWIVASDVEAPSILGVIMPVAFVFALVALIPLVIAIPHQMIMIDHFLWFLFFLCLLACSQGVTLVHRVRHVAGGK